MSKTTITKRPDAILSTDGVKLDTPSQDVDHGLVKATGMALADAAGIENEPDTAKVRKALSEEQFMAQAVDIILHEPGDSENEHRFCECTVNGEYICLPRDGNQHTVKRYHLAVIAAAKVQKLSQTKITHPDGSMGYKEKATLHPVYPFSVVHDPNPAGVTWLRQIMQRNT